MGSDQSQFAQHVNEKELIQDDVEEVIEKSEIPHFDEEQKCKNIKIVPQCLVSSLRFPGLCFCKILWFLEINSFCLFIVHRIFSRSVL